MRPELSVQLYTVRDRLDDFPRLTQELAQIGFTCVEPHRWHENVAEVGAALRETRLRAPSAHATLFLDSASSAELDLETTD